MTVFLFDAADQPVESAGFKANAILVVNAKPARTPLEPAGGQKLTGKAPSVAFQNAATTVGLVLLGTIFLLTFYNDVARLVGGG